MWARTNRIGALLIVLLMAFAAPPARAENPPSLVLPAGLACSDFDVQFDFEGQPQVNKEFYDKDGNLVRVLLAGRGSVITFTNLSSGASLTYKTGGSVSHVTFNPDGTVTVVNTGHNVIVLFPTDIPAGPSTTLFIGRVVYTVDTNGVFELQEVRGRSIDICAGLAG